jgi:subtilisin family serine protease
MRSGASTPVRPSFPVSGETTGRSLVLFADGAADEAAAALETHAGVSVAQLAAPEGEAQATEIGEGEGFVLPELGVAVVSPAVDQLQALGLAAAKSEAILAIEPERVVYALEAGSPSGPGFSGVSQEYLRGYRDAINALIAQSSPETARSVVSAAAETYQDSQVATWGLQATGVLQSHRSGHDAGVAVLDTGLDLEHPDFLGRAITPQSFVSGEEAQDGNGHGTHCMGTACGPQQPQTLPRYGIAYGARLFPGKVLNNQGRGVDGDILAGIAWAITNNCRVISMSLGAAVTAGARYSTIFEQTAQRALRAGAVIVAAAGNDSRRDLGAFAPVSHPANCPSIVAVAAVDSSLRVAFFSNRGINPGGGQIDVAGPGIDVRSSWPMPTAYNVESGTSMATPHVAGVVALIAEARPDLDAAGLIAALGQSARRLPISSMDVGAGLVQAPV